MIGNDWVPFHRRLAKGRKKALPRGVRFVLLELSLEARPTRGVLDLPLHWSTLKAVHDLLGGNRREIKKALEEFQKPDELGHKSIEIERDESKHRLILTKWEEWAGPKSSTERVREHRDRQKNAAIANGETFHAVPTRNDRNALQYSTEQNSTEQESNGVSSTRLPGLTELETEIRRHAIFAPLDAHAIAEHHAGRMMTGGQRLEWVIRSIEACAGSHAGLGLNAQALTGRLNTFMRGARAPKHDDEKPVRKFVETGDDKPPTPEELAAKRKAHDERNAKLAAERKRREEIGQPLGGGPK